MNMRHISVFRVKPEHRNEATLSLLEAQLKALPAQIPTITACEIGRKPMEMPVDSPNGEVSFYDLVQIITFASPEDCREYPMAPAHRDFLATSSQYMEQVIVIDYPIA